MRFINVKAHPVELLQQVVREFDIRLVNLVDQQHGQFGRGERLPQLAFFDIVADFMHPRIAKLAVAQARHRVIFVKPLVRLGGRFDVPLDQRRTHCRCNFLRQHGFARAGFAFDQQRAAQRDGGVDGNLEIIGGDIVFGAGKAHRADIL